MPGASAALAPALDSLSSRVPVGMPAHRGPRPAPALAETAQASPGTRLEQVPCPSSLRARPAGRPSNRRAVSGRAPVPRMGLSRERIQTGMVPRHRTGAEIGRTRGLRPGCDRPGPSRAASVRDPARGPRMDTRPGERRRAGSGRIRRFRRRSAKSRRAQPAPVPPPREPTAGPGRCGAARHVALHRGLDRRAPGDRGRAAVDDGAGRGTVRGRRRIRPVRIRERQPIARALPSIEGFRRTVRGPHAPAPACRRARRLHAHGRGGPACRRASARTHQCPEADARHHRWASSRPDRRLRRPLCTRGHPARAARVAGTMECTASA